MLTVSDAVKVPPEVESVTSVEGAFEGSTLPCARRAVRSTLEGWLVVLERHRAAQAKALEVAGALVWFAVAVAFATYIKLVVKISSFTTLKYF